MYKFRMWGDFNDMYWRYQNFPNAHGVRMQLDRDAPDATVDAQAWGSLCLGGSIYSGFLAVRGYRNVLVIPSWNDRAYRFNRLTQTKKNSYMPYGGSAIHYFPVVHWYNECDAQLTIATVTSAESFFDFLYKMYAGAAPTENRPFQNINIARSDEYYTIGDENYFRHLKGTTEEKYDAVVLMDVPESTDARFNSYALKRDFQHLCTDDFDLIEFNTHEFADDHRIYNAKNVRSDINTLLDIITPDDLKKENYHRAGDGIEAVFRTNDKNSFKKQIESLNKKIRVY